MQKHKDDSTMFKCSLCDKKYKYATSLRKHQQLSHGGEGSRVIVSTQPDEESK
jgi:uncharacterized C2H2 Zn-finger protein